MPRQFDVEGWIDEAGIRHYGGDPPNLDEPFGLFVHVSDSKDPDFHEYFWAYDFGEFDNWDDWFEYIESMIEMYGYAT